MQEALQWFGRTHEVDAFGMSGAVWRLARLPKDGGMGRQDAKTMAALDLCRQVSNGLLMQRRAQSEQDELKAFHDQQVRERG